MTCTDYYREATDADVDEFLASDHVLVDDHDSFRELADSWTRKRLALVMEKKVIQQVGVRRICDRAREFGVDVQSRRVDGRAKIVMPAEKRGLKELLRILDEDYYRGVLTRTRYVANSKTRVRRR